MHCRKLKSFVRFNAEDILEAGVHATFEKYLQAFLATNTCDSSRSEANARLRAHTKSLTVFALEENLQHYTFSDETAVDRESFKVGCNF